jgi:hypothetical protein
MEITSPLNHIVLGLPVQTVLGPEYRSKAALFVSVKQINCVPEIRSYTWGMA